MFSNISIYVYQHVVINESSITKMVEFQNVSIHSFVFSSTMVYTLQRYTTLPNSASTTNPLPDCFLDALKIHILNILNSGFMKHYNLFKYKATF